MIDYRTNIRAAWDAATPYERAAGIVWYDDALDVAGDGFGYPRHVVAGVIAAMSPGTTWAGNITIARRIIAEHARKSRRARKPRPPRSGFGLTANVAKAWRILNGEDPAAVLTSPKVGSFYRNIAGDPDLVTVDRWARRIALGDPDGHRRVSARESREMGDAYRAVAAAVGVSPREMQAATWVSFRNRHTA